MCWACPLMTCAMAVRSSGVSPFILRAKRREAICTSVTRPVTIRSMTSVISTPDKFSNFASFSIISFILVSSLYNLLDKISNRRQAIWRSDTFWMVLESINRQGFVLNSHNGLVISRTSCHFKAFWHFFN